MKISVIVSIYNAEEYLDTCIYSIINQTYEELEILLVNDGSRDTTWDICQYWSGVDPRIITLHRENRGLSAARNAGLRIATGDYVTFLDAHDYYLDLTMLEKTMKKLTEATVDMLMFQRNSDFPLTEPLSTTIDFQNLYPLVLQSRYFPHDAAAKFIKRTLILDNQLYFHKGITCRDIEWFYSLILCVKPAIILPDYGYLHQRNQNAIPPNITRKHVQDFKFCIEKHYALLQKADLNLPFKNALYASLCGHYFLFLKELSSLSKKNVHIYFKD